MQKVNRISFKLMELEQDKIPTSFELSKKYLAANSSIVYCEISFSEAGYLFEQKRNQYSFKTREKRFFLLTT